MKIATKKVFIETEHYVRSGLHFTSPAFKAFQKLCAENSLESISTTICMKETEHHLETSIDEAIAALRKFQRKAKTLLSVDDDRIKNLFADLSEDEEKKRAKDVFFNFINDCKTKILDSNSVEPEKVFTLYFSQKPPFGNSKKKSEFPDAFSLLSIDQYLKEGESIFVISEDGDVKSFASENKKFIHIESLDKLIDHYNETTNKLTKALKDAILEKTHLFNKEIESQMESADFYNESGWEDSEIEEVSVTGFSDYDISIIEIDEDSCQFTFEIDIQFEVTVSGPDFNNGIYDSEEGRMFTFENTTKSEIETKTFTIEVIVNYELIEGQVCLLEDPEVHVIGLSRGISFSVEENSFEDYR